MTKNEYLKLITRKHAKRKKIKIIFMIVLIVIAITPSLIVQFGSITGISEPVRSYMLNTLPTGFSATHLKVLNKEYPSEHFSTALLLFVYWFGFIYIFFLAIIMGAGVVVRQQFGRGKKDWLHALIDCHNVEQQLRLLVNNKRTFISRMLFIAKGRWMFFDYVSPIRRQWFYDPKYHWFRLAQVEGFSRNVFFALRKSDRYLPIAVFRNSHIEGFANAITSLTDYYYSIALRYDQRLENNFTTWRDAKALEKESLQKYADTVREASRALFGEIVESRKKPGLNTKIKKFWDEIIIRLWNQSIVRTIITVAGVNAAVMLVGAFAFGISKNAAFLTWFTASTGMIGVSIIVESRGAKGGTS